jgi:hypothetical protein
MNSTRRTDPPRRRTWPVPHARVLAPNIGRAFRDRIRQSSRHPVAASSPGAGVRSSCSSIPTSHACADCCLGPCSSVSPWTSPIRPPLLIRAQLLQARSRRGPSPMPMMKRSPISPPGSLNGFLPVCDRSRNRYHDQGRRLGTQAVSPTRPTGQAQMPDVRQPKRTLRPQALPSAAQRQVADALMPTQPGQVLQSVLQRFGPRRSGPEALEAS